MSVRQGFNIGEGSPEMGSWSLKLSPDAPGAWLWRFGATVSPSRLAGLLHRELPLETVTVATPAVALPPAGLPVEVLGAPQGAQRGGGAVRR